MEASHPAASFNVNPKGFDSEVLGEVILFPIPIYIHITWSNV